MKKTINFTGQNIAAAVLVLAYFLPWFSITFTSLSGFSLTTTAISPGLLGALISGFTRLLLIFLIVIPASGALILWQNYSPSEKYARHLGKAHLLPLVVVVAEIIAMYLKLSGGMHSAGVGDGFFSGIDTPSLFDMLGIGVYLTVAASLYLFLMKRGIVKDKNFSAPSTGQTANVPEPVTGKEE